MRSRSATGTDTCRRPRLRLDTVLLGHGPPDHEHGCDRTSRAAHALPGTCTRNRRATAFLLARLWPDVGGKPFHEDEAVAGLDLRRGRSATCCTPSSSIAAERRCTFSLAHVALAIDTTPESLRVGLARLRAAQRCRSVTTSRAGVAGRSAGLIAAGLAATSQLLLIYGTFGRMYSLFAFASALAADLFVRALERPQRADVLVAAAAALAPAHRASVRRVSVRRGGGGCALALARPDAAGGAARPRRRAARAAAPARRSPALGPLRARSRPEPRQRHLRRREPRCTHSAAPRADAASCLSLFVAARGGRDLSRSRGSQPAVAALCGRHRRRSARSSSRSRAQQG